jgi:osmotically-inducible protein OsmY
MKGMTKFGAALFLAPLLLSGGCNMKDDTAGKTTAAGPSAVDKTKEAVKEGAITTKNAVKGAAVDTKNGVKEAAVNTKAAVDKKDPAIDTKPAGDNAAAADAIAKTPVDDTRAAVDKGEAIKPKNSAVGMNTSRQVKARSTMPMHQGRDAADMDTTRRVRKAIMADQSLSSAARNVRVTTANGVVMLRGPVKSDAERDELGAKALKVAGKNRVENQLDVVAAN